VLRTYKDLPKIKFPVYILPSSDWYYADGVLFLEQQVLDETNMPGKTLGIRRVQCGRRDLFPLRKAITSLPDLIKCKHKYFIDSRGYAFIYQKTQNVKLKSYRIKRIDAKDVASILWLEGVPFPFTIERPPLPEYKWARLLHMGDAPWLIYDYATLEVKSTYRRV
jgi:hypothetical protein